MVPDAKIIITTNMKKVVAVFNIAVVFIVINLHFYFIKVMLFQRMFLFCRLKMILVISTPVMAGSGEILIVERPVYHGIQLVGWKTAWAVVKYRVPCIMS